MKKVLTLLLALALVVCMIPASAVTAFAEGEVTLTASMITVSDLTYTGTVQKPTVTVADANTTYVEGTDYTLRYKDTQISGDDKDVQNFKEVRTDNTYGIVVTPKEGGKLTGSAVGVGFKLNPINLSNTGVTDTAKKVTYSVSGNIADTYANKATVPYSESGVTLYYGGYADSAIFNETNVKVTVTDVDADKKTATLKIEGQSNGNLTGSIENIVVKQATGLTAANTTVGPRYTKTYNGVAQNVELTVTYTITGSDSKTTKKTLTQGTDYTVSPVKVTDAGNVELTITGKGNYAGTFERTVKYLQPKKTSNSSTNNITVTTLPSQVKDATPTVKVTDVIDGKTTELKMGTDYGLTINTKTVGKSKGYITVSFMGNYEGTRTQTFDVVGAGYNISNASINTSGTYSYDYDGSSHTISYVEVKATDPETSETVTLKEGTDYTVSYRYTDSDNKVQTTTSPKNAETYTLLITGKGSWGGEKEGRSLTIDKYKVSNCTVSVSVTSATKKPSVTVKGNGVTFTENTDYTIDWYTSSNKKTMYVTVTAVSDGNLSGSVKKTCSVSSKAISSCSVYFTNGKSTAVYTGSTISAPVTVKDGSTTLTQGTDYTLTIKNDAGKTVSSIKNTGTYTIEIAAKDGSGYTGSTTLKFTVTGSTQYITGLDSSYKVYPNGTVQLSAKATEGTVTYSSSDTSIATVSSTGLVTAIKAGRAKITVKTVGNTKYEPATTSTVIKVYPTKGVMTKKPWKSNGKVKVRWNKQNNVTRYEVRYSRDKNFSSGSYLTKKVSAADNDYTTQSTSLTGLKSGAKYYVKVRAVKEVYNDNGKKLTYYGKWSNWRSVKA